MTPNILYSKSKFHYLMVPYPEKPSASLFVVSNNMGVDSWVDEVAFDNAMKAYDQAVAASLASAVEFDEGDQDAITRLVSATHTFGGNINMWYPEDGQIFAVEGISVEVVNNPLSTEDYKFISRSGAHGWGWNDKGPSKKHPIETFQPMCTGCKVNYQEHAERLQLQIFNPNTP